MTRPLKGDAPLEQRLHLMLSAADVEAIDDWRFARRIGSRSEAIRQLIPQGANESPTDEESDVRS